LEKKLKISFEIKIESDKLKETFSSVLSPLIFIRKLILCVGMTKNQYFKLKVLDLHRKILWLYFSLLVYSLLKQEY